MEKIVNCILPIRAAGTYLNMVRTGLFEMDPLVPSNRLASLCSLIMHVRYSTQNPKEIKYIHTINLRTCLSLFQGHPLYKTTTTRNKDNMQVSQLYVLDFLDKHFGNSYFVCTYVVVVLWCKWGPKKRMVETCSHNDN